MPSSDVLIHLAPRTTSPMLRRIAEALGVTEDVFLAGATSESDSDESRELLRIWKELENASDRRKLLAFARTLAAGRSPD